MDSGGRFGMSIDSLLREGWMVWKPEGEGGSSKTWALAEERYAGL